MRIRAAVPTDLPAVLQLRARAYERTRHASPAAAESYFRRVLFENPWRDGALPSLVAEDEGGGLCGFIGVITRPMTVGGRAIRMAVTTQMMADPDKGRMAGLLLLREVMRGEQDLTVADAANDSSRRLWERLGGATAQLLSMTWTLPVRRLRAATIGWGSSAPARLLRLFAKPVTSFGDARRPPRLGDLELLPLDPAMASDHMATVAPPPALAPRYEPASFSWILDLVREHAGGAQVLARAVRAGGSPIGWYLGVAGPTHAGLLQLAAFPGRYEEVFRAAQADAWRAGSVFLTHRYDPRAVDSWAGSGARLERKGPWVLVHSRDPSVERAVLAGDAFLSRLEGESWLTF